MVLIRIPPDWQLPEKMVTEEAAFLNRRRLLKLLLGAGVGGTLLPMVGCQTQQPVIDAALDAALDTPELGAIAQNPAFIKVDRPVTDRRIAGQYNNFYEFGRGKSVWRAAQALPTEDWKVEVTGLVNRPQTFDQDDLKTLFPLEERVYRFRCVEAWSMVLPWLGFPMKALIDRVEPTSQAKFVRFTSWYDAKLTIGLFPGLYPWPYTEGLRIEEMANELAFFAIGIYGHELPKQHGAPLRMVLPWKYGFKGAKSIVKIEFVEAQPRTFWNTVQGNEYKFEANVEPDVPHPRWSQAQERFVAGPTFDWELRPTLPYNGYGEYVAGLYT